MLCQNHYRDQKKKSAVKITNPKEERDKSMVFTEGGLGGKMPCWRVRQIALIYLSDSKDAAAVGEEGKGGGKRDLQS